MCLGKTCINSTWGPGLSLSPVSVSTENNAICIWGVGFVLGKHALGIHPSPRWAVATSLGISLSHIRESKVVHVLLGACWLIDQGGDGQWWEDRRKLRWFWKNQMPPVSIKCPHLQLKKSLHEDHFYTLVMLQSYMWPDYNKSLLSGGGTNFSLSEHKIKVEKY